MSSSISGLDVSFIELICAYPAREALCVACPAMLLLVYEHVVTELQAGRRAVDVFCGTSRQDNLSELLAVRSLSHLFERLYPPSPSASIDEGTASAQFWRQTRVVLEAALAPPHDSKARALLTQVNGHSRFHFCGPRDSKNPGEGYPLHPVSLERALATSKRFLRTAMTCALDGSTNPLGERQLELRAVLQLAHLVPHNLSMAASGKKDITPQGLNFCMVSLQQRWWVLVAAALERVLLLSRVAVGGSDSTSSVTKPLLWQLLAVLSVLDTAQYMFAFPEKEQDFAAHHLLARLSEVGLVYPILSDDRKCFVVSPDFLHAVHWHANAPLSLTFEHLLLRGAALPSGTSIGEVRREDADTIITETNFRLYAYTSDPDLLNILNQFAELEDVVNGNLHCYRVTRDSFAAAMHKGITATQVLRFLSLRAHPCMVHRYGEPQGNIGAVAPPLSADGASTVSFSTSPRGTGAGARGMSGTPATVDPVTTLLVPQSFCDQLRMWESECRRIVFRHDVVLLRNMSTEQQKAIAAYLANAGEVDAILHTERGYMVVQQDVFERLIAPLLC